MKQWRAEPVLECLDAVTDGARRDVELLGRVLKALMAPGGFEEPQRVQRGKSQGHGATRLVMWRGGPRPRNVPSDWFQATKIRSLGPEFNSFALRQGLPDVEDQRGDRQRT